MGVAFLSDQLQDGLIIERGLLGLAEPGGAEGLQPRQVVGGDGVGGIGSSGEEQPLLGGRVQFAGGGQMFLLLEGAQGGAGLRTDDAIKRAGGNAVARQGQLRFEHVLDGAREDSGAAAVRGRALGLGAAGASARPEAGTSGCTFGGAGLG